MAEVAEEVVQRAQARVGVTLKGKWRIDALLGVGGMAVVYAATHRNNKRVAIKMLHPELSIHSDVRARFLREGYVANTVNHPGAVSVLDDDVTEDGAAFIVMELLQGETVLARAERKGGRLPAAEVLQIADQLLDVLVAAHAKGIVHRDIKPDNLLLDRNKQLKVLDFGIARLREGSEQSGTRTGSLMGTPSFMAPEQARGLWNQVDARSDLWAVGATMFALLSGSTVHEARTANEALVMAVTQHARSLATVVPDAPPALVAIVDRALAYEQDDRFPDAAEMQRAVRELFGTLESTGEIDAAAQWAAPWSPPEPSSPVTDSMAHAVTQASEPEAAAAVTNRAPPGKLTSHTTTRGLAGPSLDVAASRKRRVPILPALGVAAVGLIVVGVWLLHGRSPAPAAASASVSSAAPSPVVLRPEVAPTATAAASASASPVPSAAAATDGPNKHSPRSPASKAARDTRPDKRHPPASRPTHISAPEPRPRPAPTNSLGGRL